MKNIILTVDYELFLGSITGTVNECMIEPTKRVAKILKINNSNMTVFWDILHYYRLVELSERYPSLEKDRVAIKSQIQELIENGNDIQLHLHPHWLDAEYKNGKWVFNYDRFSLHKLSKKNDPEDINTIIGCVTITKNLLEIICREVVPNYEVNTFRAGGYLIEPFNEVMEALRNNKINIDSSVCTNLINVNGIFSYDFTGIPHSVIYNFDEDIRQIKKEGFFKELPIQSIKIPILWNVYFTIIRRLKYYRLEAGRKGTGSGKNNLLSKSSYLKKLIKLLFSPKIQMFTTDNSFKEKYNFLLNRVPDNSVQILHPKLLNEHTLDLIQENLEMQKVHFNAINNINC